MSGVPRPDRRRYGRLILFIISVMFGGAAAQDDFAVVSFDLHGVKQISEKAVHDVLATKARPWLHRFLFWKERPLFDDQEFALDLLRMEKFYRMEGFLEARVDSHRVIVDERKKTVKLRVYVDEGRPVLVEHVALRDLDGVIPDEKIWRDLPKRLTMKNGRRWREADVKADVNLIATTLAIDSFPYAQVKPATIIDSTSFRAGIEYNVSPGPLCRFDGLRVEGLEQVPQDVVLRELNIKPGKRYNQSLLAEGQQQIYRLELFQFVSVRARDFERQATYIPVDVKVREAPHNTVKLGVGYGTEDSYRASLNWRRRNFLGGGRRLESKIKSSGLEPIRAEMSLIQPHFLDRKNVAVFNPFFVREDEISFNINRLGANVSMQRHFATYTDGYLNYRFETDRIDADSVLSLQDQSAAEERKRNKSIGTFGMIRNNSRPLFNPTQGGINSIVVEYSGNAFGSKFPYWKVTVERRGFVGLGGGWVFAYRVKAGSMAPVGEQDVTPIEERFFAGGSASVRGWQRFQLGPLSDVDRTPLGGNSLFEGSTELRYPIYKIFSGAAFVDFGNVWRQTNTFVRKELHYAAGLGLRFATPIGPIRLDVAGKLNKQRAAESTFEFHLSVGQSF
jgi:outer membrane protein insertion porin family